MVNRVLQAYRSSFSGLSKETWLLSLVMLVNRAGTMAVPFMSLYVTHQLGRSLADAGLIITLFGVGSVAGAALGGWLTDRIGFRWVQIGAALVGGLLFMLFGTIRDFSILCILTVLLSLVADALRPANHAAITHFSAKDKLTRSYSLNRLAINLGWSLGGALGGMLAAINYQLLFWVEGATYILVAIMIWMLLPKATVSVKTAFSQKNKLPAGVLQPWQDGLFMKFMGLAVLFTTAFFLVFRLVPVFWKESWHLSETTIGLLLALNGIIICLVEMVLVKRWESRQHLVYYIIWGCAAVGFGFGIMLLPIASALLLAVLFIVAATFGEMLAFPFITSFVMQRSTEYNRGLYATSLTLVWSFAQIIGPSGGAWVAQHWGFQVLWWLLIVLCLFTGIGYWMLWQQMKLPSSLLNQQKNEPA